MGWCYFKVYHSNVDRMYVYLASFAEALKAAMANDVVVAKERLAEPSSAAFKDHAHFKASA